MDLAELKFVVDTKQLETAATRVAELGTAVSKLNKPMQDLNKESAKNNKELSKAEEAAAKAALAQLKLQQAQEKSADSIGKSASVLERHNLIVEYQAKGYSKGQASIMATAKASGALDGVLKELGDTLKLQRTLMGTDPFDKSIGLMQKLQNETRITSEVNALFNKNLGLTEKQMIELAREKERLIALYGIEGRDIKELAGEYDQLIRKTVEINKANDARTNSMRQQVKSQNDAAKANAYLASEMERVNRLTESGGDMTSAVNNKLIRFEQALKQSGQTAAQQAVALEKYKASLMSIQKASGNRQVDYLSRALGPQITDIAVGLATGQAPLTVLLQQGGQLRDQFALAGVAGADMGKMLVQASKAMVSSVKDIGLAVGQLVAGAVTGTGKAVVNLGMQLTGTATGMELLRNKIIDLRGEKSLLLKALDMAGKALTLGLGLAIAAAISGFIALGVAMVDVIKEENALNRALNLTGAALGLNLDMAYDAARGMEEFGVSTGTALTVLTEMAKIGGMSSDSLQMVATTAKAMKTAFDIPIADTVKQFKELQEKPTESLTKLAIKLGTIPVEVLKQVDAYERAGNTIKAAEIATKAYADAGKDAADRTVENFGTITRLGISLGKIWSSTWDSIMNIGRKGTLSEQISSAEAELKDRLKAATATSGGPFNRQLVDSDTETLKYRIMALKEQEKLLKSQEATRSTNAAAATKFEDDKKKRDEEANKRKSEAAKLEQFSNNELEKARDAYIAQVGALDHLTKAEVSLMKLRSDPLWSKVDQKIKDQIEALYGAASANERLVDAEKERQKQLDTIASLTGKADNFGKEYYATLKQLDNAFIDGNISLERYIELLGMLNQTTPEIKRLTAVQTENAKTLQEIETERNVISEQYSGDFKTADEKAAIKSVSDYKKKTAQADIEYQKQVASAGKNITDGELEMYKAQADAKKLLAQEALDREQYVLSEGYKRNQAYADAFQGLFNGMADAIVEFAKTGKLNFGDLIDSMLADLLRFELRQQMMQAYQATGGGANILTSIIGAFSGTPTPSAKGNVFNGGLQAFAKGGSFTNGIVNSPTMFNMGLMGEAGPEAIMPLRRGSDGSLGVAATGSSGGNVSVQVINNSNAQATTNETTDSKGNRKIEVIIGEMTAGEISRSGSSSQKSIKSTFGIQPQLIRR